MYVYWRTNLVLINYFVYLISPELVCKPAEIPNGKIVYSNGQKIGSTAVFSCIKGYVFQGDISVTCGKDGTWSGLKPQCKGI